MDLKKYNQLSTNTEDLNKLKNLTPNDIEFLQNDISPKDKMKVLLFIEEFRTKKQNQESKDIAASENQRTMIGVIAKEKNIIPKLENGTLDLSGEITFYSSEKIHFSRLFGALKSNIDFGNLKRLFVGNCYLEDPYFIEQLSKILQESPNLQLLDLSYNLFFTRDLNLVLVLLEKYSKCTFVILENPMADMESTKKLMN